MYAQSLMGLASPLLRDWLTPYGARAPGQTLYGPYYASKRMSLTPTAGASLMSA